MRKTHFSHSQPTLLPPTAIFSSRFLHLFQDAALRVFAQTAGKAVAFSIISINLRFLGSTFHYPKAATVDSGYTGQQQTVKKDDFKATIEVDLWLQ